MKYFVNINTLEELKKEYKRLAKKHHPDLGGDPEIMKAINAEYDKAFEALNEGTNEVNNFKDIINVLINLNGLDIEICGSWIWVSGDTFPCKDTLKALGFKWSKSKKKWYKGEIEHHKRTNMSMDKIREKYGSEKVVRDSKDNNRISA